MEKSPIDLKTFTLSMLMAVAVLLLAAIPASATTFCVPDYFAACPDNGTNAAQANLEVAMQSQSSDGVADTIRMDAFTAIDPNTVQTDGTDHLTVIGSGTDKSFITSSASTNTFVLNLNYNGRPTDMSDVTIVVPASFPDGLGGALQARGGTFDHVNIESRNPQSDGGASMIGNIVWKNSHVYGAMGGSIGFGFQTNSVGIDADLRISRTVIDDAIWGIAASDPEIAVHLSQSRISKPVGYGIYIGNGGSFSIENSVFESGGLAPISIETSSMASEQDADVSVKNSTFVAGDDPGDPAIRVAIGSGAGSHSADVTVADSILSGYENTWEMVTPFGPGIGTGELTITDSNFNPSGLPESAATVEMGDAGNIDRDPGFVGANDYHLSPGSPSIDAGDPAPGGILEDLDGTVRPLDGNGDGTRVRDQGAYEAAEIPTCATDPSLCPPLPPGPPGPPTGDVTAPVVSKLKFKAPLKKAGSLKLTLSEAATIKATFKPTPAGKGKKKRKVFKLSKKGKAGANKLVIKKRKLKPGRYRLAVTAVDAAGNRSKTVVRKVKIKSKRKA